MILRDAAGAELRFSGKPLLIWNRPDGKQNAPLFFQGTKRSESMFLQNPPDDWSPRDGLVYSIAVSAGEKIKAAISGNGVEGAKLVLVGPFSQ